MKRSFIILFLFAATLRLQAQGYIVPNGVTFSGYDSGFGYRVDVLHDPTGSVPLFSPTTQFWLNPVGKTQPTVFTNTFHFSELVDIGVDVFLVSSNDPITVETLLSGSHTWLSPYSSTNYVFPSGASFYVALYSGSYFSEPANSTSPNLYNDPVFGWAKLRNFQGAIQFLDGALEYGGAGIYAGTQNIIAVPEPGVLALAGLGAAAFAFCRRKKQP